MIFVYGHAWEHWREKGAEQVSEILLDAELESLRAEIAQLREQNKDLRREVLKMNAELAGQDKALVEMMLEYKAQAERLASEHDQLRQELAAALETIGNLGARLTTAEDERDVWQDKFQTADQVVKDYRAAFGLKEGMSGYDLMEIFKFTLKQLRTARESRKRLVALTKRKGG